ncbi:unnamed protein product [Phytophthora fragariaefolia]|uniref:Unnamed protein product n=1 Tax=Phytophthora fragariaefolia TaxID=1490495 RepID=A0A9W6XJM6_9STRA|nr:unnamed protein product [Phytophthora fragariaefolia]
MDADSKRDTISLLQYCSTESTSRRSRVPEWQTLCQSGRAFVEYFNNNPADYREPVRLARECYELFSKRPKIKRLHLGAIEAGILCVVPIGTACEHCHAGAVRVSERDINGYMDVGATEELKTLRANFIAQFASSAGGGRSTLLKGCRRLQLSVNFTPFGGFGGGGLRTPSPFQERPASGRSSAPTYPGSGILSPMNTKMIRTFDPDLTANNSLDDPASCPLCVSP